MIIISTKLITNECVYQEEAFTCLMFFKVFDVKTNIISLIHEKHEELFVVRMNFIMKTCLLLFSTYYILR
jgi:uncharacterized protein YhbP (UPF0306 family)